MVDIHSHILWGLDDGAETLEESLAMLDLAAESGTTDLVATPHANSKYRYQTEVILQRIEEVSARVSGKLRIHRGCDFHLSFDNVQNAMEDPAKYAINGGPYLLVEFPDGPLAGMKRVLTTLIDCGLIPIMTHPERHRQLRRINEDFLEWIQLGCLVQITAQSLLGRFGKQSEESAWAMVQRGLAHFIASDAHDVMDRPPRLDLAFAALANRVGESHAQLLSVENPRAVLSGARVRVDMPKQKQPWYLWWK
jgi:protein-tyrosine phosphatase